MPVHNAEIADIFERLADLLELEDANPFRVRAYRNAADLDPDLAGVWPALGEALATINEESLRLFTATFDEVLWIDRWSPPELDMNNARIVQGTDHVEALAGYVGTGIRGHVYEGVEANHPDWNVPMTNVQSSGAATDHGHCTAGPFSIGLDGSCGGAYVAKCDVGLAVGDCYEMTINVAGGGAVV